MVWIQYRLVLSCRRRKRMRRRMVQPRRSMQRSDRRCQEWEWWIEKEEWVESSEDMCASVVGWW
jgi:hypothetical protein